MKNRIVLIFSVSLILCFFLVNQKQYSKKATIPNSNPEMTEKAQEKVASNIPNKVVVPQTKSQITKKKIYKNSKVLDLIISNFDDEFGSDVSTKAVVIGDKTYKKKTVKVVRISHKKISGSHSSYLAYVNPNNGKVIRTWSRTKVEKFRYHKDDFRGFRLPGSN
jgi:hypothetical protein